jgi:hypothetical protein
MSVESQRFAGFIFACRVGAAQNLIYVSAHLACATKAPSGGSFSYNLRTTTSRPPPLPLAKIVEIDCFGEELAESAPLQR